MTELYIYIHTLNWLIAIQDLRNYLMNNVRRNFTMGLNICYKQTDIKTKLACVMCDI